MGSETHHKVLGVISGLMGVGVLVASAAFLIQIVGYQSPGRYYSYSNQYQGTDYYNASYNFFGYQFNPLIAIGAVGVVIGLLQILGSIALCCSSGNHKTLSGGWIVGHIILLIAAIVCISLGFYYTIYLYLYPPAGAYYDANSGFIGLNGNNRFSNYPAYSNGLNQQFNPIFGYNNGYNSGYNNNGLGSLFGYNGYYNPTGQAYCALLGIDILFILIALVLVGCSMRRESYDQPFEAKVYAQRSAWLTSN